MECTSTCYCQATSLAPSGRDRLSRSSTLLSYCYIHHLLFNLLISQCYFNCFYLHRLLFALLLPAKTHPIISDANNAAHGYCNRLSAVPTIRTVLISCPPGRLKKQCRYGRHGSPLFLPRLKVPASPISRHSGTYTNPAPGLQLQSIILVSSMATKIALHFLPDCNGEQTPSHASGLSHFTGEAKTHS